MPDSRRPTRTSRKPEGERAVLRSSIGPVEDLESYVKADWWRDIFNANCPRTDGDVVEDPEITDSEINAFLQMGDVEGPKGGIVRRRGRRASPPYAMMPHRSGT